MTSTSFMQTLKQRLAGYSLALIFALTFAAGASAATFVVTNTNDSGSGSLRQAILDANGHAGSDTISFDIPGSGVHVITPLSALPTITETLTIDGYTQLGAKPNNLTNADDAVLLIELNGNKAGTLTDGLKIATNVTSCLIRGLVINRFAGNAIVIGVGKGANAVQGNFIGTDPTGTIGIGNGSGANQTGGISVIGANNIIGGTTPQARNLISGMTDLNSFGVWIGSNQTDSTGNIIEGNFIGTDVTGTKKIGNGAGVLLDESSATTVGGTLSTARNIIAGNNRGVLIAFASSNQVAGNFIGMNVNGAPLGNLIGVMIQQSSNHNLVGGGTLAAGNVISGNTLFGVEIDDTCEGNTILQNAIYSNSSLGIALQFDTPLPVLTAALANQQVTNVFGSLSATANQGFQIDFFANNSCDPSGSGEGEKFLNSIDVLTDANGNANFNVNVGGVLPGQIITATVTDSNGTTSQFSQCQAVQSATTPAISINNVTQAEGNSGSTPFKFSVTLSVPSIDPVSVNYVTADGSAQAGSDYQSTAGVLVFAPGETSKLLTVNVNGDTQVEPDETFFLNLSNPVNATLGKAQGTGTIVNDDKVTTPTLQFSQASYSAPEALTALTVTVTRAGDTSAAASVDYSSADGTATQKSDFEYAAGTLSFAAGETSKTFQVLINDDMFAEGNETFSVALSNPAGAVLGQQKSATVTITDNAPESSSNPIDDAQSFVYQHYHDFLNREPDAGGLAFWTDQITTCGSDAQCVEVKRNNVSAAFFLSIEFQQTGYLLYLMQKESFASAPKYVSFMRDLQEISRGIVVNAPGWQQQLVANQQAFAAEWADRPEFKAAFDNLSNDAFVNALYQNAGLAPQQTQKDKLIAQLNGSLVTRDNILLSIANDATFRQQEQNRAFVLMEYFGYLRRDPNAAPDSDMSGYNFWLDKLNQFSGNYLNAEMVKAFTKSTEYRQRFGP